MDFTHEPSFIVSKLLTLAETQIIPKLRESVAAGNLPFGAAITTQEHLEPMTVSTNHVRDSPLLHGETNCIREFFLKPKDSRPEPCNSVFFSTHQPCSLCLSGLAWTGFPIIYYLFTYEETRDLLGIPKEIDILESVFRVRAPGDTDETLRARPLYNRRNSEEDRRHFRKEAERVKSLWEPLNSPSSSRSRNFERGKKDEALGYTGTQDQDRLTKILGGESMETRQDFVPKHQGPNVFPCHPLFNRLLRLASRNPPKICVRDLQLNCERTHLELLTDVLNLRNAIHGSLDEATKKTLKKNGGLYMAVLAPGGYEFTCAVLAILALGAAVVPMTIVLPVQEAAYFINKSQAKAVLVSSSAMDLGAELASTVSNTNNLNFHCLPILPSLFRPPLGPLDIMISSDRYLDENSPGVVIFTSGTTGPPKGSVMRRAYTFDGATAVAEHYNLTESDSILHILPVHHATGIGIMFFPFLISGCLIEFRSGSFDEGWLWDRWREGARDITKRITFFSGIPTIYMRMKRHYQRVLSRLPSAELTEYIAGARQFRVCLCGTSALPKPINDFWTSIFQKRIFQRYGATEFGAVFKVMMGDGEPPDGTVGERVPGIDLKLSDGDEGEVLVKSPWMFSKYLGDSAATAQAHDTDGYYKTGDIARREGKYYWIVGRASLDIIKSGGYKISALDVERELLSLPYIGEAMVVGVGDEEFGQRVAALVSLQNEELTNEWRQSHSSKDHKLTIDALRQDLKSRLAGYKMPTLLREIEGELPKTGTGKVMKKTLGPQFFPVDYSTQRQVQAWNPRRRSSLLSRL
ncbi:MAG: hypothetical protein M1820_003676 [Bogoriella megaspora]|nr:MAG: hypothetical protein M1820_003676 [Bogoriella megaspora]